jgi:hypothetical protein
LLFQSSQGCSVAFGDGETMQVKGEQDSGGAESERNTLFASVASKHQLYATENVSFLAAEQLYIDTYMLMVTIFCIASL